MSTGRKTNSLSRRTLSSLGLAAFTAPLAVSAASADKMRRADDLFPTDADLVRALMKMRASTDGSLRFGWLEAKRVAYIDGAVVPMMGLLAGTVSQASDNEDGTFDTNVIEITFYVDIETEEFLPTMIMPGTGKDVEVPLYRSGPKVINVSASSSIEEISDGGAGVVEGEEGGGGRAAFAPKGNVELDRSVGPVFIDGDEVWIETTEYGRVSPANPGDQPVFYKESAIWLGDRDELLDPDVHSAQTKLSYSAASSWRPWMQMGDVKGHTMAHGIGGKCSRLEDMPDHWLRLTEIHHADFVRDPAGALRGDS